MWRTAKSCAGNSLDRGTSGDGPFQSSTVELPGHSTRAGVEPATSGSSGEVSVACTTGHRARTFVHLAQKSRRGTSEKSADSAPLLHGTLYVGTTPPSREVSTSGRSPGLRVLIVEEVTLLFHHRRFLLTDLQTHLSRLQATYIAARQIQSKGPKNPRGNQRRQVESITIRSTWLLRHSGQSPMRQQGNAHYCSPFVVDSRRIRTPMRQGMTTKYARRPVRLCSSHPGLCIDLCVADFIGRSPTQMLLCHRCWPKSKLSLRYFLNYFPVYLAITYAVTYSTGVSAPQT